MNVALTRARKGLYVIGNRETLHENKVGLRRCILCGKEEFLTALLTHTAYQHWSALIESARERGCFVHVDEPNNPFRNWRTETTSGKSTAIKSGNYSPQYMGEITMAPPAKRQKTGKTGKGRRRRKREQKNGAPKEDGEV
jgi:ATP-dependent exoDNAse (exonuclease V) beta subunit